MSITQVLETLKTSEPDAVARLIDWLKIPSISTDPKYKGDVARAAEWCAAKLREAGFKIDVVPTRDKNGQPGHPMVFGTCEPDPSYKGPHVLFYGHYDVQPVDPLDLWESPPFEPVIKDGTPKGPGKRIVARGAVDDKGQVASFIEAMLAWKKVSGKAAGGAKFSIMIEGEEESGSTGLPGFIEQFKNQLKKCDVCLISDTGMIGRGKPAITYGVRGIAYTEIILHASNQDLHSGLWGGRCPNPITELARVLAQLHDKKRRVTIPGFYDDVIPLKKKERENWKKLKFNQREALWKIGLPPAADIGEEGFTALEREWGRPTAEINGIIGGYTGPGAKTVIGSHASAKVSFRLVANQDPRKITKMFFKWCKDRTPPGCKWELIDHHGGHGVTTPVDSPELRAASKALKAASGKEPSLIKSGGSIPVAGLLKSDLGLDTIFMGFGLDDDRVHSPNEKFEIDCFTLGMRSHACFVDELLKTK